ncbi:replication protein P [Haemophilus sp. SZY H52]|uniref:replication protein P n=1 Tax=Haemophilus sp. SZY H52 TaxID=3042471 RepID=UPI00351199B1
MSQVTTLNQTTAKQAPVIAEKLIDRVFEQLIASCPTLLTVQPEQLKILKQQWILGFAENGIKTFEQVKRGMAAARAKTNGYLPSVGEFISWCNSYNNHELGLPTQDELEARLQKYFGYAKEPHNFKFRSRAEYYLLKTIYDSYGKKKWEDCQRAMPKILAEVVEKARTGFEFPQIPELLEQKPKVIPPEVSKNGVAKIKEIMGIA